MRKIKLWIRRYFGFSKGEVNGFLLLISIMVLLSAAPFLFNIFYTSDETFGSPTDRQELDSLVAQLELKQPAPGKSRFNVPTVALRSFNPNSLSATEWQAFGVPEYLAKRIINYRNKVGDFTYRAELGKIYGLPDSVYQRLYPFIALPEDKPERQRAATGYARNRPAPNPKWENAPVRKERFVLAPFNINTADTTQLKQIRGIGSKLSARIIKYRNGLGGFNDMKQVQEVYGLQPDIIDSLQKYTYVHKAHEPAKLSLNNASVEELRAHPYITPNIARAIVAYRDQHGRFEQLEDLRRIKLVTQQTFEKLQPYLSL